MSRRATQPQFDYIKNLLAERNVDAETLDLVQTYREAATKGQLSSTRAGTLIDILKTMPYRQATAEVEAGIYQHGEDLFRVYLGQQSGKMLVKQVVIETHEVEALWAIQSATAIRYDYLGLASKKLPAGATRLSLEQVGILGIQCNFCLVCGRRLDDPESVDRGIGPVCAAKY